MDPLSHLDALHAAVDREAQRVAAIHGERLVCRRGCFGCCVDDLTVFEVEAEKIRRDHADLLASGTPAPVGQCAFLDDEGGCRIYASRPYVCRTQGLPLRWIDEELEAEMRDICGLNDGGTPIEELDADDCWTIGPVEERLAMLQQAAHGELRRVKLRELFKAPRAF